MNIDWDKVDKKIKRFSLKNQVKIAKCVDVYDGDTIQLVFPLQDELFRWTCRLIGIDTPEIRTKNKKEKTFGYTVRNNLREQILNKVVTVKCEDFDKYGRLLVHIYLDKDTPSINEWLIDNKFAFSYDGGKKQNWVEYLNNTNE
jgi:micrococcal nuclease